MQMKTWVLKIRKVENRGNKILWGKSLRLAKNKKFKHFFQVMEVTTKKPNQKILRRVVLEE